MVYLLKYTPSALLGVLALLSSFATLPLTFIELSSYTGVPSKNVKVDQDLRVGKEGESIKSKLKEHNAHSLQNLCCGSDVDSHSLRQVSSLKLPFLKGQEVSH